MAHCVGYIRILNHLKFSIQLRSDCMIGICGGVRGAGRCGCDRGCEARMMFACVCEPAHGSNDGISIGSKTARMTESIASVCDGMRTRIRTTGRLTRSQHPISSRVNSKINLLDYAGTIRDWFAGNWPVRRPCGASVIQHLHTAEKWPGHIFRQVIWN